MYTFERVSPVRLVGPSGQQLVHLVSKDPTTGGSVLRVARFCGFGRVR